MSGFMCLLYAAIGLAALILLAAIMAAAVWEYSEDGDV